MLVEHCDRDERARIDGILDPESWGLGPQAAAAQDALTGGADEGEL